MRPLPGSTAGCKATFGGRVTAANGDKVTFGGVGHAKSSTQVKGEVKYHDHGPAEEFGLHSLSVDSIICSAHGTAATIHVHGEIDGQTPVGFRIDVNDLGEGKLATDTFRIRLANGYDSLDQPVEGNIQVNLG